MSPRLWHQFPMVRMALLAVLILGLDQFTKELVLRSLHFGDSKGVVPGFFKVVLWGNTGAAWSLFHGSNDILALISLGALLALIALRRHFDSDTVGGQVALGLMFGGIAGNLVDRIQYGQVIDFLYFYIERRGSGEVGFPAFNVADTAICTGVGLLFLFSLRRESAPEPAAAGKTL